ncbi:MAG: polymerase sigma factor FliA [Candidatus Eremiobacteraeota bacterium]|jgi:RNA polymerase sigma factor for flagellar operon FliA|nr:polymerase sigma factor FliA [Candidatus Eremiobacteraeota bacterium]
MSPDAREERIRALMPMVRHIARRVHRMVPMSELEDLIGDGCVGLIRAVDAFDPARGVPLEQYARRLIAGSVLNGVRRMDPVTERMRRTLRFANRARYALAQELGTLPSLGSMEQFTPALSRARTEAHRRATLSLDYPLPARERLEIDRSDDPQTLLGARVERERMYGAIAELPQRERRIVLAHYFAELRLRDMVAPLQISPQRVSQLHLKALRQLRETLSATA